ncbi:DUF1876 domain-containing protein [Phycicoccus ginsengisoli]
MTGPSSTPPRIRQWQVQLTLFEHGGTTHARAVLRGDSPTPVEAVGDSTRGPSDSDVPEIGEEVAVARALRRLADRLLDTAAGDIEAVTGEHDVSLRPL